ncbi:DUF5798 family protein [Haloarchaeobius amylolyticus]|uniref:DUF5798 family protein n=1 Tax=Haloarchaeobius amylolyticus TaxID=1198296 RepID=UPI0022705868|nr:DUF5798 family protein [Haloarchaeobius amylolyticus]
MGLGSTAKKLQTLAERAEQLYAQLKDVRERLTQIEQDVDETSNTVQGLETELAEHRMLLEALAEKEGIDVDELLADGLITEAEAKGDEATDAQAAAEQQPTDQGSSTGDQGSVGSSSSE